MKKTYFRTFTLMFILSVSLIAKVLADTQPSIQPTQTSKAPRFKVPTKKLSAFVTAEDIKLGPPQAVTITLQNTSGGTENVTGIYVMNLWQASGSTCGTIFDSSITNGTGTGTGYGMMSTDVSFSNLQTAQIGTNYLYNMIYQFIAQAAAQDSLPPTTPGTGGGSGSSNQWCVQLGITTLNTGTSNGGFPPMPCTVSPFTSCTNTQPNFLLSITTSENARIPVTCTDSSPSGSSGSCDTAPGGSTVTFPTSQARFKKKSSS